MQRILCFLLSWMLCVSCAHAADLIVSAAASLTNAFRDVGKQFEQSQLGHKIVLKFASSDVLLSQIAKGAPVDVIATADVESMDRAEKLRLLAPGTRRLLLRNRLTLIVPISAAAAPAGLANLEDTAIRRIAIGNPASVPAGRYARDALEKAGLWAKLQPKTIPALSVRQALAYVARGEVDAALVYATDAAILSGKVRSVAKIPTRVPIVYPWQSSKTPATALAPLLGHRMSSVHRERVDTLMSTFELAPIADSYPSQISGGQRQRTALARALAASPRLLLLDEPFNALDTGLRARMRDEVLQVGERFNVPILLITHDNADAAAFGRQVIRIEAGTVRTTL